VAASHDEPGTTWAGLELPGHGRYGNGIRARGGTPASSRVYTIVTSAPLESATDIAKGSPVLEAGGSVTEYRRLRHRMRDRRGDVGTPSVGRPPTGTHIEFVPNYAFHIMDAAGNGVRTADFPKHAAFALRPAWEPIPGGV